MEKNKFFELVASHILEYMPEHYKEAKAEVLENTKNNITTSTPENNVRQKSSNKCSLVNLL